MQFIKYLKPSKRVARRLTMDKQPTEAQIKTYPIILDACRDCPDKDKCHRSFDEVVRCKRTGGNP